jgi:hypothetical protein
MPRRFAFGLLTLSVVALPIVTSAQGPGPQLIPDTGTIGDCSFIDGNFSFDCLPLYLSYLIRLVFGLAGGFALIEIIKGGYEYAMSGIQAIGVDKESAKKRITHALFGLAVCILAFLIVDTIVSAVFLGAP